MDRIRSAGSLLFVGGSQFVVAMIVAEALFPGYSVSANHISDLGADCSVSPCLVQPLSAPIFDASVILLGLSGVSAGYLLFRSGHRSAGTLLLLAGLGAAGVGLFPETTGGAHTVASFVTFFFAGLAAIASYRLLSPPLSHLSVVLGVLVLAALALYGSGTFLGLGPGGMERMIAYPALLWVIGAGANLVGMASADGP
ncbi:MAG: DUF998 domain-containing protein [Nitrososphaerales archaeon]